MHTSTCLKSSENVRIPSWDGFRSTSYSEKAPGAADNLHCAAQRGFFTLLHTRSPETKRFLTPALPAPRGVLASILCRMPRGQKQRTPRAPHTGRPSEPHRRAEKLNRIRIAGARKGRNRPVPTGGAHDGADILCARWSPSARFANESRLRVWEPSAPSHPHERGRFSIKLAIAYGLGMIHPHRKNVVWVSG